MKFYGVFLICILGLLNSALGSGNYAVLVQESPIGAGVITPGLGMQDFGADETITLTTVAKSGWKFVYWLGDVQDPTANRTKLNVDGPKIVIAVFERDEYAFSADNPQVSVGPPGVYPRSDVIGGDLGSGETPPSNPPSNPPDTPNNPVPEPGTIILLTIGAYMARKKCFLKTLFIRE